MSPYQKAVLAWDSVILLDISDPRIELARQVDLELSNELMPIVQQFTDGMISSVEFVEAVVRTSTSVKV